MKSSVLLPPVYQIEEGPFRGGMGSVYRVLHREWGTQLAVKQPLLLPEIFSFSSVGRRPNLDSIPSPPGKRETFAFTLWGGLLPVIRRLQGAEPDKNISCL